MAQPSSKPRGPAFEIAAKAQQQRFRDSSGYISSAVRAPRDALGQGHGHLLALGDELENLFPSVRGSGGAIEFFADRQIQWWRSPASGDPEKGVGPTRNLTSSQVACVNFLLPLAAHPVALVALLRALGDDVEEIVPIRYPGAGGSELVSLVDFEFVGVEETLEGGRFSRGAHATSCDALLLGRAGATVRAYLIEWKYAERYVGAKQKNGATRLHRYRKGYDAPDGPFNPIVPLEQVLYDPIYQIVRLGLLGDKLRRERKLPVDEARVVVVCPRGNEAYRGTITAPGLAALEPKPITLQDAVRRLWKDPLGFTMTSPEELLAAIRPALPFQLCEWDAYVRERYGW